MRKKIKYLSPSIHAINNFVTSKENIPEWYKKAPSTNNIDTPVFRKKNTLKYCVPFLDALTSGYQITLPYDITVSVIDDTPNYTWDWDEDGLVRIIQRNSEIKMHIPAPQGFHDEFHFAFEAPYSFQLPKGYSFLVTHPLNRFDLPFVTTSGIVDADILFPAGQFPFFALKGFEGVIPKGTPIAQLIPFKREKWTTSHTPKLSVLFRKLTFLIVTRHRYYFNNMWERKEYE